MVVISGQNIHYYPITRFVAVHSAYEPQPTEDSACHCIKKTVFKIMQNNAMFVMTSLRLD
ncbi:Uncharacterised protein [Psychrobacter phenylpyruvicus]|uniref:Uncharacterized protein n=1 Tax=Psychrobacter phenylpyruvicus TaxID=29432 RepID=A0A379LN41_9GAMM|nr:Uncharacterised protein [Psychrobacter phenylpyruvicus]